MGINADTGSIKRIFIDVETTGLDPAVCGIWEIGLLVEIDGVVQEEFTATMNPGDVELHESAIEKSGVSAEYISKQDNHKEVFEEFVELLDDYIDRFDKNDKFLFYAYNSKFDESFIRRWFERNNHKYYGSYFYSNSIDIMSLVGHVLASLRMKVPKFNLETICSVFNVNLSDSHRAHADIGATYKLVKVLEKDHLKVRL